MQQRYIVSDDGLRLAYADWGKRDGMPVVLCHGLAAAAVQFAADAAYFADLGYRVLCPDLRGHGLSAAPEPKAQYYGIERLARDLVLMLDDAAVGPVHWVGNSLGGIVALSLLGSNAERLRTLATFGTAYALDLPRVGAQWLVPTAYNVVGRNFIANVGGFMTTRNRAAQRLVADILRDANPEAMGTLAGVLAKYDFIANATAAELPMLMLRGENDVLVNRALPRTIAAMKGRSNFSVVEIPGGGHCTNLDAPEIMRGHLVAFWQAH